MEPFFIEGKSGPLFAIYHSPGEQQDRRADIILVPPFAEEMNRCRRMMYLQARALSAVGIGTLILDLYGTGDSAGNFGDARWDAWQADVHAGHQWLAARGRTSVSLLGIRLGGMLAAACAAAHPGAYQSLILWQPVTNGDTALTQFLRIRMAAGLTGEENKESTKDLKQRLEAGESIEVAGYDLHPELAGALAAQRLAPLGPDCRCPIHWLEVAAEDRQAISPAAGKAIGEWRAAGVEISSDVVAGEPFWNIQETTIAPALVDSTTALLARA